MRVHIVQKGDTLWEIAKQYAVGFEELKRLNAHLTNPDYIVPGMEIYLPDAVHNKEKEVKQQTVVKEQVRPIKETPVIPAKEVPVAPPVMQQKPIWQGDLYFQQPQPMPQPMPSLQHTHVHFQPTIEQSVAVPAQQPVQMPQMMPQQPIIIQQPAPPQQQQPIFIEQPIMQPHYYPQMMQPMPMPQPMPQPMPICPYCHGVKIEHPTQMQPLKVEESSEMHMKPCDDRQQQVENYYDHIQQMMCMPQPCYPPMMPYPMQMMPHMNPTTHHHKSCH